jgi:hypothetical protein
VEVRAPYRTTSCWCLCVSSVVKLRQSCVRTWGMHAFVSRGKVPHVRRIPAEDKLACFLKRLASGTCYRELGLEFDMSTAYCAVSCQETALAFTELFGSEVRTPSKEEAVASAKLFHERFGVAGCCFAIDGTHIRIRSAVELKEAYWNFKQFHSFHLHAMVDSKYGRYTFTACTASCAYLPAPCLRCFLLRCSQLHRLGCTYRMAWYVL